MIPIRELINKHRGLESLPGFDGTDNSLKEVTVVSKTKPKRILTSTKVSQWTNRIAVLTLLVGLGPEDPVADILAGGEELVGQSAAVIIRAGETVLDMYRGWQFAKGKIDRLKGGKQNQRGASIKQYSKEFQRWYHRGYKSPGDPDATKEELQQLYKEWLKDRALRLN